MVKPKDTVTHLFLDLDGTLINSLPRLKNIYHDFLSEHQIEGSMKEFAELKTSSIEKVIEYFKKKYVLNYPSHYLKKQYEQYLQKYYFKAPLFRGVKDFLDIAKDRGFHLVLTTANQKQFAKKILDFHGVGQYIEEIYTPQCFSYTQKSDLFYKKVLEQMGIDSSKALVIDDSIEVIASSIQTGLQALLFSKITYHPLPSFGSWKMLSKLWAKHVNQ